MKKICFSVLAVLLLLSFSMAPEFHITGRITGGVEGMKIYLKYADIPSKQMLDSTVLHNGQFVFHGQVASPRFYTILFKDTAKTDRYYQDKIINLFVENADISVEAPYDSLLKEIELFRGGGTSPAAIVKGSPSHDLFMRYYRKKHPLDQQKSLLFDDYISFLNPGKGVARQPREHGIALCRSMDRTDSSRKSYIMQFVKDNPSDEVLGYIAMQALQMSNINTGEIDLLINHFSNAQNKGILITKFLEDAPLTRKTAVGSRFVDFTMKDTSGSTHALSDYIGKGKYVLLECWASWCGPCRADIPHLREVYELYHPRGFDIVSISLDESSEKWLKAIDEEKMNWLQLSDLRAFEGDLPKTYRINGIPACLLFDPQGKLVTRNMRGSWMDARLIEMYGNLFAKK